MFGYTCMFWILRTYAIKLYNRTILSEQILKECLRLRGKVIFVICDLNSKEFVTKVTLVFRSLWYSETSLERLPDIFLQQLFVARRSSLWAISQDEVFFTIRFKEVSVGLQSLLRHFAKTSCLILIIFNPTKKWTN